MSDLTPVLNNDDDGEHGKKKSTTRGILHAFRLDNPNAGQVKKCHPQKFPVWGPNKQCQGYQYVSMNKSSWAVSFSNGDNQQGAGSIVTIFRDLLDETPRKTEANTLGPVIELVLI